MAARDRPCLVGLLQRREVLVLRESEEEDQGTACKAGYPYLVSSILIKSSHLCMSGGITGGKACFRVTAKLQ
ncbi:hypothetical protein U9M48_028916 [Paspalum notatum var. saurae]|uniref:Uncharacterized protein n=1 Tax=Paspalum notatum var. saurae TaxID=547442 RepID=A0AAQ3TXP1_PASNO